jgi:hypothetical protein
MSSHILELVIYELKKVFNKKIIAGGQTTVHIINNYCRGLTKGFYHCAVHCSIFTVIARSLLLVLDSFRFG